jgi:hypothetical protein
MSASWVEITRQRAVEAQVKAATLAAAERRMRAGCVQSIPTDASDYLRGLRHGKADAVGLLQYMVRCDYSDARFWAEQHRAALVDAAVLSAHEAPRVAA